MGTLLLFRNITLFTMGEKDQRGKNENRGNKQSIFPTKLQYFFSCCFQSENASDTIYIFPDSHAVI